MSRPFLDLLREVPRTRREPERSAKQLLSSVRCAFVKRRERLVAASTAPQAAAWLISH